MVSLSQALTIPGMTKHDSKRRGGKKVLQDRVFRHIGAVSTFSHQKTLNFLKFIPRILISHKEGLFGFILEARNPPKPLSIHFPLL